LHFFLSRQLAAPVSANLEKIAPEDRPRPPAPSPQAPEGLPSRGRTLSPSCIPKLLATSRCDGIRCIIVVAFLGTEQPDESVG